MWQPVSRKLPSAVHALRIATISPCAVGSFVAVTRLAPVATISPSSTMTAPNGPPRPDVTFSVASAIAFSIKIGLPCIRLGILIARCARQESRNNQIMAHAFISKRIVSPRGTRPGVLLVDDGKIRAICRPSEAPADAVAHDCGNNALLPGLVDTHVHINQPGRTEWEGFRTATQAAAAGGYTTLVDMPLNCLPETTTVPALEEKRSTAQGKCFVDWAPWGGAVADNQQHILPLARAGVLGFKCFLIYPGCDGFTMIDQQQLEAALPSIAQSGLPLLVHAELAGPIDAAAQSLANADWRRYQTYLASRPDEAELQAIRLMIQLCRQYSFRLHIVHLSTALALDDLRTARAEGLPITVETCPHYLHFAAEDIADGATLLKCAPPIRSRENQERLWAGLH